MRGTGRLFLPALAAALLLSACASRPLPVRDAQAAEEIAALKRRLLELQKQVTVHELEIDRLRQRLIDLEGQGGRGSARPSGESRPRPMEPAPTPPAAPRRGSDRIESADLPTVDLPTVDLPAGDVPAADVPAGGRVPAGPPPSTPAARREAEAAEPAASASSRRQAPPAPPAPPAAQALYDQGYALHHQGRHVDAEATFQRFLQTYGDTDLADNAGYWIGESRYAREDFRGALAAYRETLERHPEGNKVPDTLLKMGICLEQLGDLAGAREVYDEILRRFSGSAASVTAEERRSALP